MQGVDPSPTSPAALQAAVDAHPFWYHTIDIAPGVTTPGWFDLRPIVDRMPWPTVKGKRCLDIGTSDGYLAFELERRGASEVVAVDIEDHREDHQLSRDASFACPPMGEGFRLAAELTGSKVDWRAVSIYDLDPAELGMFDVVVCGSLVVHLRDPLRALEAVRSVTSGLFLSSEQIEFWLSVIGRGRPLYTLKGSGERQWFMSNAAGHTRMLYAAGFEIEQKSKPYLVEFNKHPKEARSMRNRVDEIGHRMMTGQRRPGVLHRAALCRPRV